MLPAADAAFAGGLWVRNGSRAAWFRREPSLWPGVQPVRDNQESYLTMFKPLIALVGAGVLATACTTTGNTERNAVGGAALGALAGAAIGAVSGDVGVGRGAAIGAAVGGVGGAIKGCREDGSCGANSTSKRQYYDERAGRYYYYDSATGRYYWEDGRPR